MICSRISQNLSRQVFRVFRLLERWSSWAQGKGYSTVSITAEVSTLRRLHGASPRLAVDIGGNIGSYTAELRKLDSALEIHVFEPSAVNVAKLKARFQGDDRIVIQPYALSDEAGSASLYSDEPGSGLASLANRRLDHIGLKFNVAEQVKLLRFEDYWQSELKRKPLDLVKIDVEGFEIKVLRGFGAALEASSVIQFEFGGCNLDTRVFFRDLWDFFQERQFDLYRITPFGPEPISRYREADERFLMTNYIAVNRRHRMRTQG